MAPRTQPWTYAAVVTVARRRQGVSNGWLLTMVMCVLDTHVCPPSYTPSTSTGAIGISSSGVVGGRISEARMSSIDVSDAAVQSAFKHLTDDKHATNFVLTALADGGKSTKLELVDESSGGFHGLKRKLKSLSSRILFGAFVVQALDRRNESVTSKRLKLVSFTFTPSSVNELLRAQSSFQKNAVNQSLFRGSHLSLDLSQRDLDSTFTEKVIAKRLHDATAAHKPTHYHFFDLDAKDLSVAEFEAKDDSDEEFDD